MTKKVLVVMGPIRFGGIEVWVRDMLQTINRRRFEPVVCTLLPQGAAHHPDLLAQYQTSGTQLVEIKGRLNAYDPRLIWDLYRVIRREKVALVHVNDVTWGLMAAALAGVPAIRHVHNDYKTAIYRPGFDQVLHRITPYFIATNRQVKKELTELTGVNPNRIAVIYCGINLERFSPTPAYNRAVLRQELGLHFQEQVVLTIGRLIPQKGIDFFLKMARQVLDQYGKPVKFIIVGDGPLREELEGLAQDLDLQNAVLFLGTRSDTAELLVIADVFVISSLWEAGPITLLEAMAMGKPIVATPVGRAPELIRDGKSGFLVPRKNPTIMAQRVLALLKNLDLAADFSRRARELSVFFDNKYEVRKLEAFYDCILKNCY